MPEYRIKHEGSKIKVMDGLKDVTHADIWHDQGVSKIDFQGIPNEHKPNSQEVYGLIFREVVGKFKGRLHLGTCPREFEEAVKTIANEFGFVKNRIDLPGD